MSRDVYEEIDFRKLEYTFIYQCAPVIAGLKISNLLIVNRNQIKNALMLIKEFGLSAYLLYSTPDKVSILVFNMEKTEEYLMREENVSFINSLGYNEVSMNIVLREISVKYAGYMRQTSSFPDELGIVLGYPTEDVVGYIENKGKDFLLNGYWKVYSDPDKKESLFRSFDEATEDMIRKLISEKDIRSIVNIFKAA